MSEGRVMVMTEFDHPEYLFRAPVADPHAAPQRPASAPATAGPSGAAPAAGLPVSISGLSKSFGDRAVLHDIDLLIEPGEFVAIVGRSGCGKSTLLRLVAGLETPSAGDIHLEGTRPEVQRDDVRIMFQDARLLPWKRVAANIELGLKTSDAAARARGALAQVGLADRAHDWPAVLSGGQRQRVALARALVHAPRLLLLDEPLGALDALTRIEMQQLIEGLWRENGFTALLVTHDVSEAVALADRVVLIENGRIAMDERVGLPRPRGHGDADFAAMESRVLRRVLKPAAAGQADAVAAEDVQGAAEAESEAPSKAEVFRLPA